MDERLEIEKTLNSKTFREFYYLKKELVDFCKKNNLPVCGGKIDLTDRIAYFLDNGLILKTDKNYKKHTTVDFIDESTVIEPNFVCSEKHRKFFRQRIGKGFTFNVSFQKWLKNNAGKNYKEAIDAYYRILKEKTKGQTQIDKQFEYNAYIRDFFADNKDKTLDEAIMCWKYKKQRQGSNSYERADLAALHE